MNNDDNILKSGGLKAEVCNKKTCMKNHIKTIAAICGGVVLMALCGAAQAQMTFSSGGSLTAWNGSPTYVSLANASLSGASTGQGDATITGAYGVMAETFTPSSTFTLGS